MNICENRGCDSFVLLQCVSPVYVCICLIDLVETVIKLQSQSCSKSFRCNQNVDRCYQCVTIIVMPSS